MTGSFPPAPALIAANRFGLGAGPTDLAKMGRDPRSFLRDQIAKPQATLLNGANLLASDVVWQRQWKDEETRRREREGAALLQANAATPKDFSPIKTVADTKAALPLNSQKAVQDIVLTDEIAERFKCFATTPTPFVERLVAFWMNHFAISIAKGTSVKLLAGALEREAIRPHVLGRFVDMLTAVEQHPAMLIYLDNQQSIGPNSRAGNKGARGLNENLAREIMELHTLGVDGGYTQADVTNFARVISGWTYTDPGNDEIYGGRFTFAPNRHEPGDIVVLGKTYTENGKKQGEQVLADFARHPSTARFIARKLATAFVADTPPKPLLDRLEAVFKQTDGDLAALTRALIEAPEAWNTPPTKIRSPFEFVIAAMRATQMPTNDGFLLGAMASLGQPFWQPPGPNGFPNTVAAWVAPEGMSVRLDFASQCAHRAKTPMNPNELLIAVLGASVSDETKQAVARADSREQGIALVLMSPEFQRR